MNNDKPLRHAVGMTPTLQGRYKRRPSGEGLLLLFMEEGADLLFGGAHGALLKLGFAAAATAQGCVHILAQLAQVAVTGSQAIAVAALLFGENGAEAVANRAQLFCQSAHTRAIQAGLKVEHVPQVTSSIS